MPESHQMIFLKIPRNMFHSKICLRPPKSTEEKYPLLFIFFGTLCFFFFDFLPSLFPPSSHDVNLIQSERLDAAVSFNVCSIGTRNTSDLLSPFVGDREQE